MTGATVEVNETELSLMEGNQGLSEVNVCARLTATLDGLERGVVLLLNTVADTAGEG